MFLSFSKLNLCRTWAGRQASDSNIFSFFSKGIEYVKTSRSEAKLSGAEEKHWTAYRQPSVYFISSIKLLKLLAINQRLYSNRSERASRRYWCVCRGV